MAQRAFRPPALMGGGGGGGGGGFSGGGTAAAPGFDVQGAAAAAKGLGMLGAQLFKGDGVSNQPETAAVGPGGLSGAVSGVNALQPGPGGVWAQPPMPTDIGSGGGGGGMFDFLTNMRMPSFGGFGAGGVSPSFIGGGSGGFGG
jgi:hypothetical protein